MPAPHGVRSPRRARDTDELDHEHGRPHKARCGLALAQSVLRKPALDVGPCS